MTDMTTLEEDDGLCPCCSGVPFDEKNPATWTFRTEEEVDEVRRLPNEIIAAHSRLDELAEVARRNREAIDAERG